MMNKRVYIYGIILLLGMASCRTKSKETSMAESRTEGNMPLLVDETLAPITEQEIMVFQSQYPQAYLKPKYTNEVDLINTLMNDSLYSSALMSRRLNAHEISFYKSRGVYPQTRRFAIDGIALITNEKSNISEVTLPDLLKTLSGASSNYKLVFDHPGSSTLFDLKTRAGLTAIAKNGIFVLNTPKDVIDYVQTHDDYIGLIGLNWLLQNDTTNISTPKNVKLLAVKDTTGEAYLPTQENLMEGKYPLRRELFIVNLKTNYGLGIGFASWLLGDRGQLIVLKSGLAPSVEASREVRIIKKLNIK